MFMIQKKARLKTKSSVFSTLAIPKKSPPSSAQFQGTHPSVRDPPEGVSTYVQGYPPRSNVKMHTNTEVGEGRYVQKKRADTTTCTCCCCCCCCGCCKLLFFLSITLSALFLGTANSGCCWPPHAEKRWRAFPGMTKHHHFSLCL